MDKRKTLTPSQEGVLIDWVEFRATTAKPFDVHDIRSIAYDMSGVMPGKHWHRRFTARHPDLVTSKPSNLDPKHAQNFNRSNVTAFYSLVQKVRDEYPGLPPEHIWNIDEKGVQLGRGRKQSKKYYTLKRLKHSIFYRICSDNLELVTIIECISAAGVCVPPTFILSKKGAFPALLDLDETIGAVTM